MKKILMSAAIVSIVFASCKNEELVNQGADGRMFTLEVSQGMDSRTTLAPTTGGYQTLWSEGDQIYVTSEDGKTTGVLTLDPQDAGKPSGSFSGYVFGDGALKSVIYPVPSNGVIDLKNQQADKLNAPMSGTIEGQNVTLNNEVAIIKLNIIDLPENAKLTLSGDNIVSSAAWNGLSFENGENNEFIVNGAEANKNIYVPVFVKNTEIGETSLSVKINDGSVYTLPEAVELGVKKVSVNVPALVCQSDNSLIKAGVEGSGVTTVSPGEYAIPTLNTSCQTENATVWVEAGEYKNLSLTNVAEGVTIVCEEGTVFTETSGANMNGATIVGATFAVKNPEKNKGSISGTINGTFKSCTFEGRNGLRYCYAGETVVFEDCVFSGSVYGVHFDGGANEATFRRCTFSGFNAFGSAITQLTLEYCTFVSNGISGYNGINMWGDTKMTECEFTFDGTAEYEWVDMCGDNKTAEFSKCTVNGKPLTNENVGDYGDDNKLIIDGVGY